MPQITIRCGICQEDVIRGSCEVLGRPVVHALCDQCKQDREILYEVSREFAEMDEKFKQIVKDL